MPSQMRGILQAFNYFCHSTENGGMRHWLSAYRVCHLPLRDITQQCFMGATVIPFQHYRLTVLIDAGLYARLS